MQTLPLTEQTKVAKAGHPDGRMDNPKITPAAASIKQALEMINGYRRPIIIVGYGAKYSMPEVIALAKKLNAPILTTFKT